MVVPTAPELGEMENYKRFGSDLSLTEDEIPVTVTNRKLTDKYFLVVFLACVLLLIPFLAYTLSYSNINRLINGYDDCGNVCGQNNTKYPEWDCTGKDMTDKPIHFGRSCIIRYMHGIPIHLRRVYKNYGVKSNGSYMDDESYYEGTYETTDDPSFIGFIQRVGWKLTVACLVSIVLSQGMLLSFRYATAMTVWTILITSWIFLFGLCIVLWKIAIETDYNIVGVIFYSIGLLILFCIMVFMRNRIRLVVMLLRESCRSVFEIPTTFFIPLMAITCTLIIIVVWGILTIYMWSSGELIELYNGTKEYQWTASMLFALVFNLIMAIWCIEFIYGLQYMIISGTISKWYFTRDKTLLSSPVKTSAFVTFKFHLGTIAAGSLVLTLVTILRCILLALAKHPRLRALIDYCMRYLETILRIFTKNAYIMTALHGSSFYKSGKKALKLIKLNVCNICVLNSITNFVLRMAQIFLMAISGCLAAYVFLIGEKEKFEDYWTYSIIIVVIVSGISSYTILGTLETTVDAMFVCFCEDSVMNDGVNKPYFMTRGLMEFIESSKTHFADTIQKKGLPTI